LVDYPAMTDPPTIHALRTDELKPYQIAALRELLWAAFGDDEDGAFSEDDWLHSLGGTHFVAEAGGAIVAHASVVERELHVADQPLRTGYVEAVAVAPALQGRGHGTAVMRNVNELIARDFTIGALGTGSQGFYERLGWRTWRGPSFVRTPSGLLATPDDDGYIMVLVTSSAPALDLASPITCEWRPGDVW
jgi:aminoglycoside 2'-N-acetyltransferase I